MDRKISAKYCTGCSACLNICPMGAISNVNDGGFWRAKIDDTICIDCNMCVDFCNTPIVKDYCSEPQAFAYRINDEKVLYNSSSGGAFWAIAESIITNGGIVWAVIMDDDFKVKYDRITNTEDLRRAQKAKYVQCQCDMIYKDVEEVLRNDLASGVERQYLFIGTPCVVSKLRMYLHICDIDTSGILFVDFVCHGVPNPRIYEEWLMSIKKYDLTELRFRDKGIGWRGVNISAINGRFKRINPKLANAYAILYTKKLTIRESCFHCEYADIYRDSDITLGDYWGKGNNETKRLINDGKGLSMILVHNEKGAMLIDRIKTSGVLVSQEIGAVLQPQLLGATEKPVAYDKFWCTYAKYGFVKTYKKYGVVKFSRLRKCIRKIRKWKHV